MDKEKESKAIERLKFFEPLDGRGYYLAYSGGKDSDVILALAKMAGVKFDAVHNLTTVDAPETVYHVRDMGVTIDKPDMTMWELIVHKLLPPYRNNRYCCAELKERGGRGRTVLTGVRKAESVKRAKNGGLVKIIGKPKTLMKEADQRGIDYEQSPQGGMILNNDNDESREFVEHCYRQTKVMVNPIIDWTDKDVWEFIKHYDLKINPLYECGFNRVGCIGCPLVSPNKRYKEFRLYPTYKDSYIRAFDKMVKRREEMGKVNTTWRDGLSVFKIWMQEDPAQLSLFDSEYDEFL